MSYLNNPHPNPLPKGEGTFQKFLEKKKQNFIEKRLQAIIDIPFFIPKIKFAPSPFGRGLGRGGDYFNNFISGFFIVKLFRRVL